MPPVFFLSVMLIGVLCIVIIFPKLPNLFDIIAKHFDPKNKSK